MTTLRVLYLTRKKRLYQISKSNRIISIFKYTYNLSFSLFKLNAINLKIYKPNSDSIVFYIENGFNGSIKKKNQQFLTTKANGNGIGIESVKYVVHKYNGDVNIKTDENKFIVSGVLLQPLDATK